MLLVWMMFVGGDVVVANVVVVVVVTFTDDDGGVATTSVETKKAFSHRLSGLKVIITIVVTGRFPETEPPMSPRVVLALTFC